jgi:hypothetical protein
MLDRKDTLRDARRHGCWLPVRVMARVWQLTGAFALVACTEHAQPSRQSDAGDRTSATEIDEASSGAAEKPDVDAAPGRDEAQRTSPADLDAGVLDAGVSASSAAARSDTGAATVRVRTNLVLPELWTPLDAGQDPFDDRPAVVDCSPLAVMTETLGGERVLGVDTGGCNYLSAAQATLRDVVAGEILKVRLWHFELSAPEPAEAHAVVLVDGLAVLDERVTIPQSGGLIVKQMRAERAVAAGSPVYFHLHNHGTNSWALVEVSAGP